MSDDKQTPDDHAAASPGETPTVHNAQPGPAGDAGLTAHSPDSVVEFGQGIGVSAESVRVQELRAKLTTARVLAVIFGIAALVLAVLVVLQATALRPSGSASAPSSSSGPSSQASGDVKPSTSATAGPSLAERVARNLPDDAMAFGDPEAPVTIIEYIDYRCPYCASFTNNTFPTIKTEFIDTGKVRYEVHDVSFFGEDSTAAAVAARAAAAQGRFGEFMTVLYAAAPESGHPDMPRETLVGFAKSAGVPDLVAFEAALDDPTAATAVTTDTTNAQQMGVDSVPFFVIGEVAMAGAQPIDTFRSAIEEQLALQ